MVLGWFDAGPAVAFATKLAGEIRKSIPPGDEPRGRKDVAKRAKRLDRFVTEVRAFTQAHRLNFYKKAKLANTLRWSLREAGYADDFVEEMVRVVVVNL